MTVYHFPVWLSRFIGRENEIITIKNLLSKTRLLTLTGPGGCGKTRLALEVTGAMGECYRDGVCLVELAPVLNADLISQTTASALGLFELAGRSIDDLLVRHLKTQNLLLVLDNCEHLIDDCARFAHLLLAECPELHILATSREPLHIAGEMTWLVPSMTLPDWQPGLPPEDLLRSEAVTLFVERVRSINPDFSINPHNAPAIVQICHHLDGIPLALELAAARTNILTVNEMAGRIRDTFRWLAGSDRLAPARQQTLRATLDWSFALLTQEEQCFFRRLCVFNGDFGLEAAEAICSGDGIDPEQALTLLSRLVDKSFVARDHESSVVSRYRMLEIVRQYGIEKLAASGEESAVRSRHLAWYLTFARLAGKEVFHSERGFWVTRIEEEMPNLRHAFAWSQAGSGQAESGNHLARVLIQFWQLRGYFREGLDWHQSLLAHPDGIPKNTLAESFSGASFFAQHLEDFDSAARYSAEAIVLFEEAGNREGIAWEKGCSGYIAMRKGDYHLARRLIDESLSLYQEMSAVIQTGLILFHACDLAYIEGDFSRAKRCVEESLFIMNETNNGMFSARRMVRLAEILIVEGDLVRAHEMLVESIKTGRGSGDRWFAAMVLVGVANLTAVLGKMNEAAQCLGAAQVFVESFGTSLWPVDRLIFENQNRRVRANLEEQAFTAARHEGQL
ncbi:MAG: hypothetical protein EHM70_24350, partial [Chloroflexota bacterium]